MLLGILLSPAAASGDDDAVRAQWPASCDEAVSQLLRTLPEGDRATIRATARGDLVRFHHGLGTRIRNGFGLWQGNTALMQSCLEPGEGAQAHPDDVSMIIIERAWRALRARDGSGDPAADDVQWRTDPAAEAWHRRRPARARVAPGGYRSPASRRKSPGCRIALPAGPIPPLSRERDPLIHCGFPGPACGSAHKARVARSIMSIQDIRLRS